MEIIKRTSLDAWITALEYILPSGHRLHDCNNRTSHEVLGLRIEITDPAEGIDEPIKFLHTFKQWVYPSMDEIASIILTKRLSPTYVYSYGNSLFNHEHVNQIDDFIIPLLKKDSSSRRAVATLWNPRQVAESKEGIMPSLIFIDFKLRDNKLHLTAFIRSTDMFFGWPANLYQLFILQQYVKEKLNCELGSLVTYSTSAHLFEEHLDDVYSVLERKSGIRTYS